MTLTETQLQQLALLLEQLKDPTTDTLSEEQMMLYLIEPGYIRSLRYDCYYVDSLELSHQAQLAGYYERCEKATQPPAVRSYREHREMTAKNERTMPARIKTQRAIADRAWDRIHGMESAHSSAVEGSWKRYEKLSAEDRLWLHQAQAGAVLPPTVREHPTYEAVMGELSPIRRAQITAIEKLLEASDEEAAND